MAVANDEQPELDAEAEEEEEEEEEPVLVEGVLGVVKQDRRVIGEHGYGLAKRDAVLPDVLRILLRVPIKLQLGH